jgi:plastocyanin
LDNGRHVDVVIVDDPVSYDNEEWERPSAPGQTRFVQYQWFNELNTLVNTIDDDGQTEPTGTITYGTSASTPQFHGNHVTGTACGKWYGWANEANIYNLAVTDAWPSGQQVGALLIYDYLRAFHQSKPVNNATGKKNPTVSNHSYGGVRTLNEAEGVLQLADIGSVVYRGTTYSSSSPGPSGWTTSGLETDFGIRFNLDRYPSYNASVAADVQDCIDDGIIFIGAAGNDNLLMDVPGGTDWDNRIIMNNGYGTIYYNRGAWPCTADTECINVGALSDHSEFRRSTYTMFGPGVDIFAPGDGILSVFGNTGIADSKYSAGNYYQQIQGTSMASPQVAGIAACFANTKERVSNKDIRGYLQKTSVEGDMTFDVSGGTFNDSTCQKGSPNKYLQAINPRENIGFLAETKSERPTVGLGFPRQGVFMAPAPAQISTVPARTFDITVGNSGSSHYTMTGVDAQNAIFPTQNDPTIYAHVGDTLEFDLNASGHPFYIKTSATTGTGNQVTTGTISGNGRAVGAVTWDTTGVTPGTYYYICEYHSGMVGSIVISQPPARPTYASVLGNWLSSSIITSIGYDRNGQIANTIGNNFNYNVGDIIKFQLNSMSGHPIWIKTSSTTGTGNAVTTGTVTNNGSDTGTITWDTTGVTPGTYYYQCEVHNSMDGAIVIS